MGGQIRQGFEGLAHPAGAGHLAERADMREARRAIAGLEHDAGCRLSGLGAPFDSRQQLAGFLERPGLGVKRLFPQIFHELFHVSLGLTLSVSKGRES